MWISDELAALVSRAEAASATARRLLHENDRWHRSVDYMFELGAEFTRPAISHLPLPGRNLLLKISDALRD